MIYIINICIYIGVYLIKWLTKRKWYLDLDLRTKTFCPLFEDWRLTDLLPVILHTPQERKNSKRGFSSRFGRFRHLLWVGWALFFLPKKVRFKKSQGKHMMKQEFYMHHSPNLLLHPPRIKHQNELNGCFSRCFEGFAIAFVRTYWIRQAETLEEVGWKRQLETKNMGWFLLSMLLAFTHGIVVLPTGMAYRSSSSSSPPHPTNQK